MPGMEELLGRITLSPTSTIHCDLQGFLYLLVFISLCLISRIHNPYGMY